MRYDCRLLSLSFGRLSGLGLSSLDSIVCWRKELYQFSVLVFYDLLQLAIIQYYYLDNLLSHRLASKS
jgi:hypothetical protein